jgi:hypothetical protein
MGDGNMSERGNSNGLPAISDTNRCKHGNAFCGLGLLRIDNGDELETTEFVPPLMDTAENLPGCVAAPGGTTFIDAADDLISESYQPTTICDI